jgi:coenzyme Q-binding protein COQ10
VNIKETYSFLAKAISTDASLFKELITTWQFSPRSPTNCLVDFSIQFEFASPLHAQASNVFFDQVSQLMMKAFIDRCHGVYGGRIAKAKIN